MHLGNNTITPTCVLIGAGVATLSMGVAYLAARRVRAPQPWKFATATAMIFAAQMFNVPVLAGTPLSGHMLGSFLLAHAFGPAWGVLGMAMVLAVQSVLVGDGGLMALGLNIINMAIIPAALIYPLWRHFFATSTGYKRNITLALAAWISVIAAAGAGAVELLSRDDARQNAWLVVSLMLATHALIGVIEAVGTVAAICLMRSCERSLTVAAKPWAMAGALSAMLLAALLGSSPFPDGLEFTLHSAMLQQTDSMRQSLLLFQDYDLFSSLAGIGMLLTLAAIFTRIHQASATGADSQGACV